VAATAEGVVFMTEKRSEEERRPRLNDDEPDVEGHKFRHGAEGEAERRPRLNEDDQDDTPDVEGHRYGR
jgi:hypothetical protein